MSKGSSMKVDLHHFRNSASGRRVCQVLANRKIKPEMFLQLILDTVEDIRPALHEDATYSTEILCGPDLWEHWGIAERRCAGICLAYLIEIQMLPLEQAKPAGKYPLRFRLKTPS
jgi:hypothetical protein